MKELLNHLFNYGKLSFNEAKETMLDITSEKYDPYQVCAFVTCFNMRPITTSELDGFRAGLLEKCIRVNFDDRPCLDIVGTGGDGKNTFNISTLSAVVIAGAGIPVAKHGSTSSSSICGSSNVLKHLGYKFSANQDDLNKQLDESKLTFLHAPFFHPTMKSVGPIRKALGVKTFFNMLGPLVHPAQPSHSFFGVFDRALTRTYQEVLNKQNRNYNIVHNLDGYDEISLTDDFLIRGNRANKTYKPDEINMPRYSEDDLFGGNTVAENAKVFMNVLMDESTQAQKDVVIANSAFCIKLFDQNCSLKEAIQIAKESIESGRALKNFKKLLN